jgi:dTDP-4-amino-4,6-dideoxygalactose transaminase
MLALRAVDPAGPVVLPSFTFSASAHAIAWVGRACVFAECLDDSFHLDCADAAARSDGIGAVMATHVFGAPSPVEDVERLAATHGVPVVFDAAHAFGARHGGRPVGGFGTVEVFSLSPTKPVVAGEGGLVTTNDDAVAEVVRIGRDYANPGDYDTRFVGLNARMSELHAAVALESFADIDTNLAARIDIANAYRRLLADVDGITPQTVDDGDVSTYKDFTVAVDPEAFGVSRDVLVGALAADGVDTRCYFDPPVHRQQSHRQDPPVVLPTTERASSRVVSLPVYPALTSATVERIAELVAQIAGRADQVEAALASA